MRLRTSIGALCLALAALAAVGVSPAAATTIVPASAWTPLAVAGPTHLPPSQSEVQQVGVDAEGGTFALTFHHLAASGRGKGLFDTITDVSTTTGAFAVGQSIEGDGIKAGTTIVAVGPGTITPSQYVIAGKPGVFLIATDASQASTPPLPYNASDAEVEAALDALPLIGGAGGSVAVSGGPGGKGGKTPYSLSFGGSFAESNVPQLGADGSALSGSPHSAVVTTPAQGGAGSGTIALYAQNVGGKTSAGTITLKDTLPAGIATTATPFDSNNGSNWSCSPGAGQSAIECTSSEAVQPGLGPTAIDIPVEVKAGAKTGENTITISGGGAASPAAYKAPITVSSTPAKPGVAAYTAGTYDADGTPSPQASSHPYASDAVVLVNTIRTKDGATVVPAGDPKTIAIDLPPGFLGNPTATPRCTEGLLDRECPLESQVGLAGPITSAFGNSPAASAVHSVEAPIGYPAKFTLGLFGDYYQANLLASLRSDEDYGVRITAPNIALITPVYGSFASVWGDPAAPVHNTQRCTLMGNNTQPGTGCGPAEVVKDKAFVTMPADCAFEAEVPPLVNAEFDSWQEPGVFAHESFAVPPVSGCDALSMGGEFGFEPETHEAAAPSAYEAELTLPQEGLVEPEGLATPPPKRTEFTLPEGVTLNAAAVDGIAACSLGQIGFREYGPAPNHTRFDKEPNHCPDASKVGTVEVQTELLENPLHGALYLAAQNENPFGSLLAVYLVIEDPSVGLIIKLPGEMRADPQTGQLTTVFDDLPQAAVGKVLLKLKGGDRAPLATPDTCGAFATEGTITPWSAPESGAPLQTKTSFQIYTGPNGRHCANTPGERPFDLSMQAGSASPQAGAFSPFSLRLTRPDGDQAIKSLAIETPPGFIATLKGVSRCSEAQIAAAKARASGRAEQSNPSCPASSQVGTTLVGAGVGPTPFYAQGKLYLAGPYKGAPLSIVAITPAVAGPFDLGNVVIRNAAFLDPKTAQVTAVSDEIPRLVKGIPTEVKDVRINLDRHDFAINPTSCELSAVKLTAEGDSGATDHLSSRFQVGNCAALGFQPSLSLKLLGGTKRGKFPALRGVYRPRPGDANAASLLVRLPHSAFLEQAHFRTICTRVQFAAGPGNGAGCPAASAYGHVTAHTPLLEQPLEGPVYLRSSDHNLPDLVLALHGPPSLPIQIEAVGRIDSIKGGIRSTFEAIPDAPISEVVLEMEGAKKGLIVNSTDLCAKKHFAEVDLSAHNGKLDSLMPAIAAAGCAKGHRHKGKRHSNRRHHPSAGGRGR